MLYYDWTWFLAIPGLLLGLWAQFKVNHAYQKYAQVSTTRGVSAEQVAREILHRSGNSDVIVSPIDGKLTDHFDPRDHTLRLSEGVFGSKSIAAIGIAAHECGHAMQEGSGYGPIKLRKAVVPVVEFGSKLYFPIFLLGMLFEWEPLMSLGIIFFALIVLFSLVTLPVEWDASKRAVATLADGEYVTEKELEGVKAVLNAASLTYVAAAISGVLQLVRLVLMSRSRSRRRG